MLNRNALLLIVALACLGAGCGLLPTSTPPGAVVAVTFDMGTGGAGFAATIYAQEVTTGKTFKVFYPAGSHGGVVLPTSPPVDLRVEAPGTYVFYCRLINEPDSYHYGATGCQIGESCGERGLLALEVQPGKRYQVTINDRSVRLPGSTDEPVSVPWRK